MTKSRLWAVLMALVLVIGSLALASCGDDDDEGDGGGGGDTTAQDGGAPADLGTIEEGKLLVGTDTPFPPFEIGQPPDISGYDIEVMNGIAEQLGVEVTYQDTGFDTIFRDVQQGLFDTAAAASTITPERQQQVNFTDPYYEAQQALLAPTGSDIASVNDLGGKIVGTQDGTTGEAYANDETDAGEVRGFPEGPDATTALTTGQVEAVIIDQPVAIDLTEQQQGFEIVEEIATGELYGFAVAKQNTALLEAMNEALATMKQDGTLDSLYQKYFKIKPPKSVTEGTTKAG
jgi:polar amino acid transport system substrate-binding protein